MASLFTSCFRSKENRRSPECHDNIRTRRVLVRTSTETKNEPFSRQRSSETFVDEKVALHDDDGYTKEYGEEEEEETISETYLSEQHIEAGDNHLEVREREERVEKHRFGRRSVKFLPKKKKKGSQAVLKPHHTGDELQRRFEFERKVRKLDPIDAERAWEAEEKRRREWDAEKRKARSR